MNEHGQIIFTYMHCDKSNFKHEVNFDEEAFGQEAAKLFETSVPVERVNLEFILEDKQGSGRFICVIVLESPIIDFKHTEESYDNYAGAVHRAIHKAVEYLRQEKEKLTEK